ncbi:MAG: methyltransferase, partial [Candidatus Hydromicrobium sp.]|nr:methyltransferase [Candidatus Hydromicrobium sp.]
MNENKIKDELINLIYSYRKAQLLYIAAKLQIADILLNGPLSYKEISKKTGTHVDALYRVLRALASFGIFKENKDKSFEITSYSKFLTKNHPSKLNTIIIMRMEEFNWKPWGELLYSVKTGKSSFEKIFGMNLFEYLSKTPDASKIFNESMDIYSEMDADKIMESYDFSGFNKIADIGGGYGKLLTKILSRYENATGILFDLPNVVEEIKESNENIGDNSRLEIISGDFFETIPAGCDLYILRKIIHDWDDKHAIKILKNCCKASEKGSRILLIEQIMDKERQNEEAKINDIHMLVQTIEGRERTEEEYRDLLNRAGYRVNTVAANY